MPFDFLSAEQNGSVRSVRSLETLGAPDAVIIPGTKNTTLDLDYIRRIAMRLRNWWAHDFGSCSLSWLPRMLPRL